MADDGNYRVLRKSFNASLAKRFKKGGSAATDLFRRCLILAIRETCLHSSEMKRTGSIAMLVYLAHHIESGDEPLSSRIFDPNFMRIFL